MKSVLVQSVTMKVEEETCETCRRKRKGKTRFDKRSSKNCFMNIIKQVMTVSDSVLEMQKRQHKAY